jgi:hypothetical protein
MDPISYAQKAIALNEFNAPRWAALQTPDGQPVGATVLGQRGLPTENWCGAHACLPPVLHAALVLIPVNWATFMETE